MLSDTVVGRDVAAAAPSAHGMAVRIRGLKKVYEVRHATRATTLAEVVVTGIRGVMKKQAVEEFRALDGVDLDVKRGEVVGLIGRNGAGKSTLLKVLSRITEPSAGVVELYGRVGSLLEVGTGFHPELTGRENVYLNGSILGMRRAEIRKQFDAIVEFAGVEKFLDTPVKRYSSGMYVRLAFAVAAHLEPEILIVDEVLAVGDAEFQKKCLGKMRDVSAGGRTVLLVTHNMAVVRQLCQTAVLMRAGRVVMKGEPDAVVGEYLKSGARPALAGGVNEHGLELTGVSLVDALTGMTTESPVFDRAYVLEVGVRAHRRLKNGALVVRVTDDMGAVVSSLCTVEEGVEWFDFDGDVRVRFTLPRLQLYPGRYRVDVSVTRANEATHYLYAEGAMAFDVEPAMVRDAVWAYRKEHGVCRICDGAVVVAGAEKRDDVRV
jgi:lipopolysaccharide transport system ATP-binding protein